MFCKLICRSVRAMYICINVINIEYNTSRSRQQAFFISIIEAPLCITYVYFDFFFKNESPNNGEKQFKTFVWSFYVFKMWIQGNQDNFKDN